LRGQIKILVENHGGEKRQVNVGMQLRRTLPAKLLTSACAIGLLLSAALGVPWGVGLFAAVLPAAEGVLGHRLYRFARAFRAAVAGAFRSLPVVALPRKPAATARR